MTLWCKSCVSRRGSSRGRGWFQRHRRYSHLLPVSEALVVAAIHSASRVTFLSGSVLLLVSSCESVTGLVLETPERPDQDSVLFVSKFSGCLAFQGGMETSDFWIWGAKPISWIRAWFTGREPWSEEFPRRLCSHSPLTWLLAISYLIPLLVKGLTTLFPSQFGLESNAVEWSAVRNQGAEHPWPLSIPAWWSLHVWSRDSGWGRFSEKEQNANSKQDRAHLTPEITNLVQFLRWECRGDETLESHLKDCTFGWKFSTWGCVARFQPLTRHLLCSMCAQCSVHSYWCQIVRIWLAVGQKPLHGQVSGIRCQHQMKPDAVFQSTFELSRLSEKHNCRSPCHSKDLDHETLESHGLFMRLFP